MKTQIISQNNSSQFTVNKKQVSKNRTLKTSVLYSKVEFSVNSSINLHKYSNFHFKSIEFDIFKKAYLNDNIIIKNNIKKLSNTEIVLNVTVSVKKETICNAIFSYNLQ
jgi:hypothetical protein